MHLKVVYEANILVCGRHLTNGNEDEVDLQVESKVKGKVRRIGQSGTVDAILHNIREGLPSGTDWSGGRRGVKERKMREAEEEEGQGEEEDEGGWRNVEREEGSEGGWE